MSDAVSAASHDPHPSSRMPWFLTTTPDASAEVERMRLTELITTSLDAHPVAVIAAPSGFGKTTAAAHWAARASQPVAWLRLTRFDRDASRIAAGAVAALRRVLDDVDANGAFDGAPDLIPAPALAQRLADYVADRDVTLVVDQAELADDLAASVVGALAVHAPANLRLLILWAGAPDHVIHRLGPAAVPAIIEADDLAVTDAELLAGAAHFGRSLSRADADAIMTRTRGWPLAVRLAVDANAAHGSIDDFVEQELLPSFTDAEIAVIRATVVATALDAATAAALVTDAVTHLESFVRRSLFLERYSDTGRRRYAWHPAFRAAVLSIEQRRDPVGVRRAHARVGRVVASSDPLMAIEHLLAADRPDEAHRVLLESWLILLQEGRTGGLDRAAASFPAPHADSALLQYIRACCATALRDPAGAQVHARRARAVTTTSTPAESAASILARLLITEDPQQLRGLLGDAEAAVASPDAVPAELLAHALFTMGYAALRVRRGPVSAVDTLRAAYHEAEVQGRTRLAERVAGTLAFALAFEGRFADALELTERSLAPEAHGDDEWLTYDGGSAATTAGFVAYWRGDLETAHTHFESVFSLPGGATAFEPVAQMYEGLASAASGDAAWQARALERVRAMPTATIMGTPWRGFRDCAMAELALARGRVDDAARYADRVAAEDDFLPVPLAMAAEVYRRVGRSADARAIVAVTDAARLTGPARVRLQLTDALLRAAAGRDDAHLLLERALDSAAPERIVTPFRSSREALAELLTRHTRWGTRHEAFVIEILAGPAPQSASTLTPREAEVLAYLRTPMTLIEIGETIYLSTNTVKTHVQAIYRKLGVSSRRDAVRVRI